MNSGFWIGGRGVEMISFILPMMSTESVVGGTVGGVGGCWLSSWFVVETLC